MGLNKKIRQLKANRPVYKIPGEAFTNQEIAQRQAFGTPAEIVSANTALNQNVSDAVSQATKVSDSGSSILATLSAINAQKQNSYLDLAKQESAIRNQKLGDLYRSNYAMIDEMDKAFEYNVNTPYTNELDMLQEKKRQRTENWWKAADVVASLGTSVIGNIGG